MHTLPIVCDMSGCRSPTHGGGLLLALSRTQSKVMIAIRQESRLSVLIALKQSTFPLGTVRVLESLNWV